MNWFIPVFIVFSVLILFVLYEVYLLFFRLWSVRNPFKFSQVKIMEQGGVRYLLHNGMPVHGRFGEDGRPRLDQNAGWRLTIAGSESMVDLPHCFNTADSPDKDYEGPAIYEKLVDLSGFAEDRNARYHLVVEGSFLETGIHIDGQRIGVSREGYLPIRFDISQRIAGKTQFKLKAVVSNRITKCSIPPLLYKNHPLGFHPYGGIHKSVYIEKCPAVYCFKCHVDADPSGRVKASLGLYGKITGEFPIELGLYDEGNSRVGNSVVNAPADGDSGIHTCACTMTVEHPELWSPESPHLYRLEVTTKLEKLCVQFGFRSVQLGKGGFELNGRPVKLKGVCKHEEDIGCGLAVPQNLLAQDMELLKGLNVNFVRLAHYPHDPCFLDLCDREGMLAWEEIALYQAGMAPIKYVSSKKAGGDGALMRVLKLPGMIARTRQFTDRGLLSAAHDDLLRMIERDYNHPSVLIWGVGNECWTLNPAGAKALRALKELALGYDPGRPQGYAAMTIPHLTERFERSFRVMEIACVNEYFGWYYGNFGDLDGFLKAIGRKCAGKPILVTETGADCKSGLHDAGPDPAKGTEEFQSLYLRNHLSRLAKNSRICGVAVWVLKDFLCPEYGEENFVPYQNAKGLVDSTQNKKGAFYAVRNSFARGWGENE